MPDRKKAFSGVFVGRDGWASTKLDDEIALHLKLSVSDDGQLRVTEMLVTAPEVTTDVLRQIHPTRVLAAVADGAVELDPGIAGPMALALERLRRANDDKTPLAGLRARARNRFTPPKRPALPRPDGTDVEAFYGAVAAAYRSASHESGAPATVLAEENGVPVETVRRWIKEARRRGHLPPGRKGRVG